jgi:hypothetical protein
MYDVIVGMTPTRSETWCSHAQENNAFYCERSGQYFDDENFRSVWDYNDELVCRQWCARYEGLQHWDSDDSYHYEDEPNSGRLIVGYHHSSKPWELDGFKWKPKMIGVELEVWSDDRNAAAEYATDLGFACEHDGSVCDTHGFEVIGAPMEFKQFANPANPWRKFCDNSGVKSWHGRNGSYGMHVSINTKGCSLLNITKAVVFIHGNVALCEAIAGRNSDEWARYYNDVTTKNARRRSGSHSAAVSWVQHTGRFELRIFKGNARWEGFVRNVEFTHSVIGFTRQAKITKGELTEAHYTRWMYEQDACNDHYPAMTRWLRAREAVRNAPLPAPLRPMPPMASQQEMARLALEECAAHEEAVARRARAAMGVGPMPNSNGWA